MTNINEIYKEYYNSVFDYLNWKIRDRQYAEDVASKVFAKIDRLNKSEYRFNSELSSLKTWIYKIAHDQLIDFIRMDNKMNNKSSLVSDFVNSNGDSAFVFNSPSQANDLIENKELRQRILKSFRNLKPNYRKIATMYFIRENTYEEISQSLNLPLGSVKGMISRCRAMLKADLTDLHKGAKSNVQCTEIEEISEV